jgi:vacuolar-type H+-ATPase subunit C/Vma6
MSQATRYASTMVKVGSERGTLLSEDKLKMLAEHKSLKDFVSDLRGTALQEKIDKLQQPFTSRKLEKLFREDQVEAYCQNELQERANR